MRASSRFIPEVVRPAVDVAACNEAAGLRRSNLAALEDAGKTNGRLLLAREMERTRQAHRDFVNFMKTENLNG